MGAIFLLIITMVNSAIIRPNVVEAARGVPPRMRNAETKFRIPLGQKQFKLICPIIATDKDNTMIQWSKNGEQLDWDSQYKLSKDGTELKMKSVKFEDSGRYQCQATNGFGHKTMEFIVHVHDQHDRGNSVKDYLVLSNSTASPSWLIDMNSEWRSPIKINTGGKLELRCPAQGNPLPEIRWYQNEMEISEKTHKHVSSIVIEPVDSSQSGVYRCVVENSLGSLSFAFDVTVGDFFDPPTTDPTEHQQHSMEPVIDQPYNISVYAGHTAQFQCKVKSNENTLIKWLKEVSDPAAIRRMDPNATIIHANGMNLLVLDHIQTESTVPLEDLENVYTNRLTITKVDYHHAGKYICVVTSAQGHIVYKSAELQVLSSSLITFPFTSDGFLVVLGAIVTLFVFFVVLAIIWLKKNQESSSAKDLKPPPPPRMPPPAAPQENDWNSDRTLHSSKPLLLHNAMFKQTTPLKFHAATMDRNNLLRAERRFDEVSNVYDNSTVHPYWTQQRNNNSIYNGGYRTLEVQNHRNYPTSDEYTDQDMFYYKR
ncbi:unnamed protein product [Caenorhabditis sp. 36 PRJEB53466]|nr:unnamed protein product [Caenorhabditis sp. 36 PRJEB53466]